MASTVRITDELIDAGSSRQEGWTKEQLALLGVAWPPPKGWRRDILGRPIDAEAAARFVELAKNGKN